MYKEMPQWNTPLGRKCLGTLKEYLDDDQDLLKKSNWRLLCLLLVSQPRDLKGMI
jgi:hypothetical protein